MSTVIATTGNEAPENVNGTLTVNWLPNAAEGVLAYHVVNAERTSTGISVCASVVPVVGTK